MPITFHPLTVNIGAEVRGIDLATLDAESFHEIGRAFLRYKVLFFRNQQSFDRHAHAALGRRFGELMVPSVQEHAADQPEIYVLRSGGEMPRPTTDGWHVDSTHVATPPRMAILRAVAVPDVGGDTLWADMEAVYDALSDSMKQCIGGLRATYSISKVGNLAGYGERVQANASHLPPVDHPLVRTHPETGRRCLFVNQVSAIGIAGMPQSDADALLEQLYGLAANPEFQCRWRWRNDDVAMWDNRCTQHYAVCDYLPNPRLMERVNVKGTRPV